MLADPEEPEPDVIISALKMVPMDGMQFVAKLRREKNTTPVFLTTGNTDELLHEVAVQAGATRVLTIPLSGPVLIKAMETALGFSLR